MVEVHVVLAVVVVVEQVLLEVTVFPDKRVLAAPGQHGHILV